MRRAGPLRKRGNVATERGVVHLVEEHSNESGGLVGWVWLELGMDLDDEGRSDGGEQIGLGSKSAHAHPSNAHNPQISVPYSNPLHTSS